MKFLKNLFKNENGAALTEYALLVALIAVAAIVAIMALGGKITAIFNYIAGQINPPGGP